ncbi:hypothetical protein C8Q80DRAFT_1094703 [Daedaleopsis nitida]|nr:hypothetical protein C8Q80DRAFT_1094703 [Daedaleopsis nitida]
MSEYGSMPNTPHPLQPPMVPIAPAFARPSTATSRDVKFASQPIMRSETEDTVLPGRGQKGDDFWRRFSMVVKEDMATPAAQKQSIWLRKTQNGTTRMSRWVWIIGVTLLIIIAGAIGLGWYVSHNNTTSTAPKAIGGSANEKANESASVAAAAAAAATGAHGVSTTDQSLHVSPTHTVAKRIFEAVPTAAAVYPVEPRSGNGSVHRVHVQMHQRNGRRNSPLNRSS